MHITCFPEFIASFLISDMSDSDKMVVPVSSGQFVQLLEAINSSQKCMEEQFEEFRAEVCQGQEDAAAKAMKRAKYKKPYTYKRKGNEEQATFNEAQQKDCRGRSRARGSWALYDSGSPARIGWTQARSATTC